MLLMTAYEGKLIGGPHDGDSATASVSRIPVLYQKKIWLDGFGGNAKIELISGDYVWDENKEYFKWELTGGSFTTRNTD